MDLLKAMMLSGSSSNLMAGMQFATMGTTGSASTGVHNHLEAWSNGNRLAPSEVFTAMGIPQGFQDKGTLLTGFALNTPYNDSRLLAEIMAYSKETPAFNKQAYVNAHAELFQPYWENQGNYQYFKEFDPETMQYKIRGVRGGW